MWSAFLHRAERPASPGPGVFSSAAAAPCAQTRGDDPDSSTSQLGRVSSSPSTCQASPAVTMASLQPRHCVGLMQQRGTKCMLELVSSFFFLSSTTAKSNQLFPEWCRQTQPHFGEALLRNVSFSSLAPGFSYCFLN